LTINVEEEEKDDVRSPGAVTLPPAKTPHNVVSMEERATKTPRRAIAAKECSRLGADVPGDVGSQKRAKKGPPRPIRPGLRSAIK
jgi:hypothetical protein